MNRLPFAVNYRYYDNRAIKQRIPQFKMNENPRNNGKIVFYRDARAKSVKVSLQDEQKFGS